MSQSDADLAKIITYMKAHWPSQVKPEWQVDFEQYLAIAPKVIADFTKNKTTGSELVRIAGLSGSGKTTQVLPAAEAYFANKNRRPILVAARAFVTYHPHYKEILEHYGEADLRKMTDEFATIMMFLVLSKLIEKHFDIILDVTLLDPSMEAILLKIMQENHYESTLLLMAVSPEVTEKFLGDRAWRHTKATEQEFIRATKLALDFYAANHPDMRSVLWNVYEEAPVYDGPVKDSIKIFDHFSQVTEIPEHDTEILREAKIKYLTS